MSFRINRGYIQPLQQQVQQRKENIGIGKNHQSFQDILNQEIQKSKGDIKISSHANKRLLERKIVLNDHDLEALGNAMDKAKSKGARESLMLYKNIALIASVTNRTVITAMDPKNSNENVFTNIDSAVIVE